MKTKVIYGLIIACLVLVSGILYIKENKSQEMSIEVQETVINDRDDTEFPKIVVYVAGAVKAPDVYEVDEHSRLYEIIEIAGGFLDTASKDSLNLARFVFDGEMIYVYEQASKESIPVSAEERFSKVSINQANEEELMTVTGIGATKARAIIEFRKVNGPFQKLEDIMKVDGIKDAMFNKFKEEITI